MSGIACFTRHDALEKKSTTFDRATRLMMTLVWYRVYGAFGRKKRLPLLPTEPKSKIMSQAATQDAFVPPGLTQRRGAYER